ncbi:hypothetical protein N2152v2_003612 [Parachlorella kessleri]
MTPQRAMGPALPSSRPTRFRQTSRLSTVVFAQAGRRRPSSRPYSSSPGAQQQTEPPLGAGSSAAWTEPSVSSVGGAAGNASRNSNQGASRSGDQGRELMDVQLFILFGLPTVVLLLPWVLTEPLSWALFAPLLLFIPGPRDIANSLISKLLLRRPQQQGSPAAAAAEPGPCLWEVPERMWEVQAPPPPPPPGPFQRWPYRPPAADATPRQAEPFYQPKAAAGSYATADPMSAPASESTPAGGVPAWQGLWAQGDVPGSRSAPGNVAAFVSPPIAGDAAFGAGAFGGAEGPAGRAAYGSAAQHAPRGVATAATAGGGRVIRPAGRGRVGIDLDPQQSPPGVLKTLFSVLPFLQSWGGFM